MRHGATIERFQHQMTWSAFLEPTEHERVTRRNLEAIVRVAREAGVPIVLASYVHAAGPHGVANRAMQGIPGALFVPQVYPDDLATFLPVLGPEEGPAASSCRTYTARTGLRGRRGPPARGARSPRSSSRPAMRLCQSRAAHGAAVAARGGGDAGEVPPREGRSPRRPGALTHWN